MNDFFRRFSHWAADRLGSPWAFVVAVTVVIVWALMGPAAMYSETWQLLINTGTTVVTFLMVFIIQNTQNHDSRALHLKLDELIHAVESARDDLVDIENASEDEQAAHLQEFEDIRRSANGTAALPGR
ncbi:MAG: low affinity iron permease family protein [Dehalococcoidia bacterium]|jgi:low affinity Fe/Cu permease